MNQFHSDEEMWAALDELFIQQEQERQEAAERSEDKFLRILKAIVKLRPPNVNDDKSVLQTLYECYDEQKPHDSQQINRGFRALYEQMNGMPLREMDQILYPVCMLCRDHEKQGFISGVQIGVRLARELGFIP